LVIVYERDHEGRRVYKNNKRYKRRNQAEYSDLDTVTCDDSEIEARRVPLVISKCTACNTATYNFEMLDVNETCIVVTNKGE